MRNLFVFFALLSLLSPLTTSIARAADEQPIKDRLWQFETAWNKSDTTSMAALWAEDGTLINPAGVVAKGRDAMIKFFAQEHATIFKDTRYKVSATSFQWVSPDVAIVDVSGVVSGIHKPDGSAAPDFVHHVTWVFAKKDGQWLAAAARAYQFLATPAEKSEPKSGEK